MKVGKFETKFDIGGVVHVVFWDDDIGAWNVERHEVERIALVIDAKGHGVAYVFRKGLGETYAEDEPLFGTFCEAAKRARELNGNVADSAPKTRARKK